MIAVLFALFLASVPFASAATEPAKNPYPGITYREEARQDPPMRLFVAEVDLSNPHVHLRVARGGPDPDGPGIWQTTLMRPTKIAEREGFDLVVNGDFFSARGIKDAEGAKSRYSTGNWAFVEGAAATDGNAWSSATNNRPCLVIHKDGKAAFEKLSHADVPEDWEVISGNVMLLKNGAPQPHKNKTLNPRTAVGLDATGTKLTILVVDGRKPGISIGMSYDDLAKEMIHLGCRNALNLDGGGSSVFALRDPATSRMRILNTPSDGHERPVASALGIFVDPASRP